MTILLQGKLLAQHFHTSIKAEVDILTANNRIRKPGLGVILVGANPASMAYVATKEKVARDKCGFETFDIQLLETASYDEVADAINEFNQDSRIDGVLMQLPLPKHLDSSALIQLIDPSKDADGLHPLNQGLLQNGLAKLIPCTPLGVLQLIDLAYLLQDNPSLSIEAKDFDLSKLIPRDLSGQKAVVIGRSILVGKPVAALLLERNATVEIVHSRTKNIAQHCQQADLLIAAVGKENLVRPDWVKSSAIVIDVGINRTSSGNLVGDVDFETVAPLVKAITPVPGGVGPMTVAMLMRNTLQAFKLRLNDQLQL